MELVVCAAAWRWERAGGIAIVAGASVLAAAAWVAAPTSAGNELALSGAAIYGLPFLLVGLLFVRGGRRREKTGARGGRDKPVHVQEPREETRQTNKKPGVERPCQALFLCVQGRRVRSAAVPAAYAW